MMSESKNYFDMTEKETSFDLAKARALIRSYVVGEVFSYPHVSAASNFYTAVYQQSAWWRFSENLLGVEISGGVDLCHRVLALCCCCQPWTRKLMRLMPTGKLAFADGSEAPASIPTASGIVFVPKWDPSWGPEELTPEHRAMIEATLAAEVTAQSVAFEMRAP